MANEYIAWGEPFPDLASDNLTHDTGKKLLELCNRSEDFDVIDLRRISENEVVSDIIVVDCINDFVPAVNQHNIKRRERLAIVCSKEKCSEVRALRKDFPKVPHTNHVPTGEPSSLCLYFEPWSVVERIWTPQKHLQRILWWLSETAKGTLHRPDQPVEPMYFEPAVEILLPPDFDEKVSDQNLSLVAEAINTSKGELKVIRCKFLSHAQAASFGYPHFFPIVISLPPVLHGEIEHSPDNLGALHEQLAARGATFVDEIKGAVRSKAVGGLVHNPNGRCLLILQIPICREQGAKPERHDVKAYLIPNDVTELGAAIGALCSFNGKYYCDEAIAGHVVQPDEWKTLKALPAGVSPTISKNFVRKASGIDNESAEFNGVVAGVGALGGALSDIWSKEAWGNWTLLDSDHMRAHNVLRHIARDESIGKYKVDAVKDAMQKNFHPGYYQVNAIASSIQDKISTGVDASITEAELLIDVTTTIEVPRDLSQFNDVPRSASLFLTPSSRSSVLIFEDENREIRLDVLEAQYYRAILNTSWGQVHLEGHFGSMWVGAGCRDISAVISFELIAMHAAILARQMRMTQTKPEACIRIWNHDEGTGAVKFVEVPVATPRRCDAGGWKVCWDDAIVEKLSCFRHAGLPNETGGVILGYIDHKIKTIYVIDVLAAPPDSQEEPGSFVRGTEGLQEVLTDAGKRTANIVGYIGEWHSHPQFSSAYPSQTDRELIARLTETLKLDGQPALMIIIGAASEISITLGFDND
jgi:integrative and conjugative element protein (TIGR02256 family)